jgi:hypothetical protein
VDIDRAGSPHLDNAMLRTEGIGPG